MSANATSGTASHSPDRVPCGSGTGVAVTACDPNPRPDATQARDARTAAEAAVLVAGVRQLYATGMGASSPGSVSLRSSLFRTASVVTSETTANPAATQKARLKP